MAIVDFGLCSAIREAIAQNQPGGFYRVQAIFDCDYYYNSATELVTFVDNHDMPRFLSINSNWDKLELAIALIMTSRGIPCLYYGTEQYLHNDTNGGNDPYNRPMMEYWDTNTDLYQMVQKLSQLRQNNPAVSRGSHEPKYVSENVYAYLRRYRENRCLVIMNKGYSTTINLENPELPDGNYTCLLTGRTLTLQNNYFGGLYLAENECLVLSCTGQPLEAKMIVRAQLNGVQTQIGERIVVTGDCPELGNWDLDQAYGLEYINKNTWFGEIPFNESAGKAIAYKYALVTSWGDPRRENIQSRRWILANQGIVKWRDRWMF